MPAASMVEGGRGLWCKSARPDEKIQMDDMQDAVLPTPTLHLLCGKVAAGKSTLAAQLAAMPRTILIAQDTWMAALYPGEVRTIADYVRLVPRLRAVLGPHVADLLRAGLSVVLDWPANTRTSRAWMRTIFRAAGSSHQLHVLDVPDEVCLARLEARNASGRHEYTVSRAEFEELTGYLELPTPDEGFAVVRYP
jgi:predicted kinase